ncbi:MAG: PilZ domain-containing protein [Candidatus Omnitrophica bacterium]|nr:PilZ domain-containing protein [Candidatus Omnitrophota bacterium]MCM8793410.1 PilZ domain-containing protein [Candidatus Omnitrophota bacterium]
MVNPYFEQERRKYPRVYASIPMQFRPIGEFDKLPHDTITRDLSEGGVRFSSDKFIPVGTRIIVNVLLEGHREPLRSVAKIIWTRKQQYSDNYEVGCQFMNLPEDARSRIGKFISHQPPA